MMNGAQPILNLMMLPILASLAMSSTAAGQSTDGTLKKPMSIGNEMEALTSKFNNPDPIVEMDAYNRAFADPNPIIRQMALSSAANSTNPEIRAIALVGAMEHVKSLVLSFTSPKQSDDVNSSSANLYNVTGGMLTLQIEKFDTNDGSFTYVTDDADKEYNLQNKKFSQGTITGETIQMNIKWDASNSLESCPTTMSLKDGKLSGTMTCTGFYILIRAPISATIF